MSDAFRALFDANRSNLQEAYAALDWEQKAALLRSLIEAGDHPPGFGVTFSIATLTAGERDYLRSIGIGPRPEQETPDAR